MNCVEKSKLQVLSPRLNTAPFLRMKFCFSTTSSRKPSRCNRAAAAEPAGPAPMISTSTSVGIGISTRPQTFLLDLFGLQQRRNALNVFDERTVGRERGGNAAHDVVQFSIIAAHYGLVTAQVSRLGQ